VGRKGSFDSPIGLRWPRLALTGVAALPNADARPGDPLVLGKPLGVGIFSAAR